MQEFSTGEEADGGHSRNVFSQQCFFQQKCYVKYKGISEKSLQEITLSGHRKIDLWETAPAS